MMNFFEELLKLFMLFCAIGVIGIFAIFIGYLFTRTIKFIAWERKRREAERNENKA